MTWQGREAEEWMKALDEGGDERSSGSSIAELSPDQQARVRRLAALIEQKPEPKKNKWIVSGALAGGLAAAAALVLSLQGPTAAPDAPPPPAQLAKLGGSGAATLERAGKRTGMSFGAPLINGDRVHASGQVTVHFQEGARAMLDGQSSLELLKSPTTEGVHLQSGRVSLQIPKQAPGKTWSVVTGNTQVTVVGTAFSVWLADDKGAHITCVSVTEGRVMAESSAHTSMLGPGEVWSSAPESSVCSPQEKGIDEALNAPVVEPKKPRQAAPQKTHQGSSLAEQNAQFLEIVQARRGGDQARAQRLGKTFLRKHPKSPFASQVRAELDK